MGIPMYTDPVTKPKKEERVAQSTTSTSFTSIDLPPIDEYNMRFRLLPFVARQTNLNGSFSTFRNTATSEPRIISSNAEEVVALSDRNDVFDMTNLGHEAEEIIRRRNIGARLISLANRVRQLHNEQHINASSQ